VTAFLLSAAGAAVLLLAPLGARAGIWGYLAGFLLMAAAIVLGAVGAMLSIGSAFKTGAPVPIAATLLGIIVIAIPAWMILSFRGAPAIHDISTDTDNPPRFNRVLALRRGARNPPEYDGPQAAARQRAAYPDLQPLTLTLPPDQALERARAAATGLGWEIVAGDARADVDERAGGGSTVEAVDTTFWFGFKDDIVIRVTAADTGSRIDVRSKSRVGVGDGGTNARRIRAFRDALQRSERRP
jgi:uncharacterized protein (DUF1499 family)